MSREIELYKENSYKGKNARLFTEWEMIDRRYCNDEQVSYIIRKRNGLGLPIAYDIIFNVKTIIGVEEADEQGLQKPIFGKGPHVMRISLPNNYPGRLSDEIPDFNFSTDVWHPNIRYFGDFKGHVCLNIPEYPVSTNLVVFIDNTIAYLCYETYHAKNEHPFPEDLSVAEWVLNQGEPQGWLDFEQD